MSARHSQISTEELWVREAFAQIRLDHGPIYHRWVECNQKQGTHESQDGNRQVPRKLSLLLR